MLGNSDIFRKLHFLYSTFSVSHICTGFTFFTEETLRSLSLILSQFVSICSYMMSKPLLVLFCHFSVFLIQN